MPTNSFPERHTDYCGGCGFVDLDFAVSAEDVFPNDGTTAHLSCYEGLATVKGRGVEINALAWSDQDVIALRIEDRREKPEAISINLRMLRPPELRTRSHLAVSKLEARNNRIALEAEIYRRRFLLRIGGGCGCDRPRSPDAADQR